MRIAILARWPVAADPQLPPLLSTLADAGHDVIVVTDPAGAKRLTQRARIETTRGPSRLRTRLSRVAGRDYQNLRASAAARTLRRVGPDIVYALRELDAEIAASIGRPVLAPVSLTPVEHDLRWSAPEAPHLATGNVASEFHTPQDQRPPTTPELGRHAGCSVVLVARFTSTNPSRYLRTALERAGVTVVAQNAVLDWDAVPPEADGVVVVESPWPALPVRGRRPSGVPLAFWVHHGEHHLPVNLRLARRYGADTILLAHSWHLAHRFDTPVHRFPFAIAPEVFSGGRAWRDRELDVAAVGAGLGDRTSSRYPRRAAWTRALAALGERAALTYGLTPEEMARLYGRSRIVLNEGGTRHLPVTMRVFEAIGSGSLLVTDPLPGTDLLLGSGLWEPLDDERLVDQVTSLATAPDSEARAASARHYALGRHTYDHRGDELLSILRATRVRDHGTAGEPALDGAMDDDVEVQTVAALDVSVDLPDRVVAVGDDAATRLVTGRFDAVIVAASSTVDAVGARTIVNGARRFLYARRPAADALTAACPDVIWNAAGPWMRSDRDGPGYRVRAADHPLAD